MNKLYLLAVLGWGWALAASITAAALVSERDDALIAAQQSLETSKKSGEIADRAIVEAKDSQALASDCTTALAKSLGK